MHLSYTEKLFINKYFPSLQKWLIKNNIVLTDKNYYPFYFVYAILRGYDKKKIEYYMKIIRPLASIGLPLSVFLFFTSRELILLVIGNQCDASVPVFKILICAAGIQIILSTSDLIFLAANDSKHLFYPGIISTIFMISAIVPGIVFFNTIESVASFLLVTFILSFFILINVVLKQSLIKFLENY